MTNFEDSDPTAPEMPLAFDDQGRPVKVTEPVVYDDEPEAAETPARDYGRLFSLLIVGAPDAETIRRRVLCLAYLLKAAHGPQTLAQLGLALGVTKQGAAKWLTKFRKILPQLARESGFDG